MAHLTRFILLTSIRTGSTMLASGLNTNPEIVCFGELFNLSVEYVGFNVAGYDNNSPEDRALRDKDFKAFLERRIFSQPEPVRAAGFKAIREEMPYFPGLWDWLAAQRDIHAINLRRRNLVRSLVSWRIAEATGEWVVTKPQPFASRSPLLTPARLAVRSFRRLLGTSKQAVAPAPRKTITLSAEECRSYFDSVEQTTDKYVRLFEGHPLQTVYYEDLVGDHGRTLAEVQSFLGVTPRGLSFTTRRQNPEPLRTLITNYGELRQAFLSTPYAPFFDD